MDTKGLRMHVHAIDDLSAEWHVSHAQMRLWLSTGRLFARVWLPVMSVYEQIEVNGDRQLRLCHWEGYIDLSRHYCHRVFRTGQVDLREIVCSESKKQYVLPEAADSIVITLNDLVVSEDECVRFLGELSDQGIVLENATHGLRSKSANEIQSVDTAFKIVRFQGEDYRFGDLQAKILCLLRDAALRGDPWQNGKRLLAQAGSQSFTLSNVFKRNPIWRELILSDGRGSYRIDPRWVRPSDKKAPLVRGKNWISPVDS